MLRTTFFHIFDHFYLHKSIMLSIAFSVSHIVCDSNSNIINRKIHLQCCFEFSFLSAQKMCNNKVVKTIQCSSSSFSPIFFSSQSINVSVIEFDSLPFPLNTQVFPKVIYLLYIASSSIFFFASLYRNDYSRCYILLSTENEVRPVFKDFLNHCVTSNYVSLFFSFLAVQCTKKNPER